MNLRGIVSISGKSGLFKAIGQNKSGYILESLDEKKNKVVTNSTNKLATLMDITVYGEKDDLLLPDILQKIHDTKDSIPLPDLKADGAILKQYFSKLVPEHDAERVYGSDIKKILSWYHILSPMPLFTEKDPGEVTEEVVVEEKSAE